MLKNFNPFKIIVNCLILVSLETKALTNTPAHLANEGLDAVHGAGVITPRSCHDLQFDIDTDQTISVVSAGTGDFCTNPAGAMCGNGSEARGKIELRRNIRNNEVYKQAFLSQIQGGGTGNINDTFAEAKRLITKKIDDCEKCNASTKTQMKNKIASVTLVICPAAPAEGSALYRGCGSDGLNNNAFYDPNGTGTVNLCLGRIFSACPTGTNFQANASTVGAYLFGTLAHELGHAIQDITQVDATTPDGKPWGPYGAILKCIRADDNDLYKNSKSVLAETEGRDEAIADFWSLAAIGEYANFDRAIQGRGSLCESAGGKGDHPYSSDRLMWLRSSTAIAARRCGGNVPAKSCMDKSWVK